MGDNVYLGDRNGVRTPMQWSGDRNAGFSSGQLAAAVPAVDHRSGVPLPVDQRRRPAEQPALAAVVDEAPDRAAPAAPGVRARLAHIPAPGEPAHRRVHARVRRREDPRRRQHVALRPVRRAGHERHRGLVPVEMFGRVEFPRVEDAAAGTEPCAARLPVVLARGRSERSRARSCARPTSSRRRSSKRQPTWAPCSAVRLGTS